MISYVFKKLSLNLLLLVIATAGRKPRAIVHLGPSKTGTTHVQSVLANAKNDLESNNIVNFDTSKCQSSHVSLSYYMGDYEILERWKIKIKKSCWYDRKAVQYFFTKNLKKGHDIIISSEFLFLRPIHGFEVLLELLNGFDVTFVSVYRQWLLREYSNENQRVKNSSRPCFIED